MSSTLRRRFIAPAAAVGALSLVLAGCAADEPGAGGNGGGGAEVVQRCADLLAEGVRFLALSVSDAAEDVVAVIRAGARGYVTKNIAPADLSSAVVQVAETLELRETLARTLLVDTLWHQLLLLGVIAAVTVIVVQRATQPVRRLGEAIERRAADDLSPVEAPDAPRELRPLIDATTRVMGRLQGLIDHQNRFVRDSATSCAPRSRCSRCRCSRRGAAICRPNRRSPTSIAP